MTLRMFRPKLSPREMLAVDPRALSTEYDDQSSQETDSEEIDCVAVVNIRGPLEHHKNWMWDSYESILERLEKAFGDDTVHAVVMCIDSPGGDAAGATEVHRQIQRLKKKYEKPLYAYSNESMYSAAYSIGSAADEIWVPDTGGVGSVGVICALLDRTKQNEKLGLNIKLLTSGDRKADSHADRPLTDDIINTLQERVHYLANVFFKTVGKARGLAPKKVAALEAGIFLGQQAVDVGLADGVAGWYKFLQYVSGKLVSSTSITDDAKSKSEKSSMKTLAQLKQARDEALAAFLSPKAKPSDNTKLKTAYESAVQAVADYQAKTKYSKKTEETEETDDEEEEEESDEEEEEEEEEEDDDDGDDDDDSDEEEEEEEEENSKKKAKSLSVSSLSKKSIERLFSTVQSITGKNDPDEIFGALDGISARMKKQDKLESRLTKIETNSKKDKVSIMLTKAQKDGRISPAQAKGLREPGMSNPKWLKGYLDAQPKQVRQIEDGDSMPSLNESDEVPTSNLTKDQTKIMRQAADSAGMSLVDYMKEMKKHMKTNGSLPKA